MVFFYLQVLHDTAATSRVHAGHENSVRHVFKTDGALARLVTARHEPLEHTRPKGLAVLASFARKLGHQLLQLDGTIFDIHRSICAARFVLAYYKNWVITYLAHPRIDISIYRIA